MKASTMRYDYPSIAPTLTADLRRVTAQLQHGPLDRRTLALVELRVSQINGCAFCIDRHGRDALRAGASLGMVIGLSAWRDDQRFDPKVRVMLALAEAWCDPGQHADRHAAYAALDEVLTPAEIVHLTIAISLAGAWNRIASGCQRQPENAPWPQSPTSTGDSKPAASFKVVDYTQHQQSEPDWKEYSNLFSGTPALITGLIRSLPQRLWHETDAPGRWTIQQIAAHLVHTEEESWMPRIRLIHDQSAAKLPRVDAHRHLERYATWSMEDLLVRFGEMRQQNLQQMEALQLDADQLTRVGEHPDQGPVQLRHLIATWCMHDLDHLDQMVRVVGARYASHAGPLATYLRICRPSG